MARNSKAPEFEQALEELERLVETLERGDLPLDQALRNFERGVELTRHCQGALKAAQQRVEILLRRNGEAEPAPFEAEGADEAGACAGPPADAEPGAAVPEVPPTVGAPARSPAAQPEPVKP